MVSERDATRESVSPQRTRERRNLKAIAGTGVVVVVVLGFASYKLIDRAGQSPKGHLAAAPVARHTASSPPATTAIAGPSSTPSASPSTSPSTRAASPAQVLKPVSATAFGPGGTADGDGAAQASYVIDGSTATGWRSDWYATSQFGGLQTGTGIMVDLGRTETVDSVQAVLGSEPGAAFDVRTGNTPTPSGLTTTATATSASGTTTLKLTTPSQARYVLLWFTALPSDGAGTYQAQVDEITVTGQP